MIELVTAMTILSVGILAVVAGFSSGANALERSRDASSAAAVAESQMEELRAVPFDDALLTATCFAPLTACTAPTPVPITAADGRKYNRQVWVAWACPSGSSGGTLANPTCTPETAGLPVKLVRIVIKNSANTRTLFTQTSTFSLLTG